MAQGISGEESTSGPLASISTCRNLTLTPDLDLTCISPMTAVGFQPFDSQGILQTRQLDADVSALFETDLGKTLSIRNL